MRQAHIYWEFSQLGLILADSQPITDTKVISKERADYAWKYKEYKITSGHLSI